VRLYLPSYELARAEDVFRLRRDLLAYGVPVEQILCAHRLDLVARLGEIEPHAVRRAAYL
jgi:hypothetical protein